MAIQIRSQRRDPTHNWQINPARNWQINPARNWQINPARNWQINPARNWQINPARNWQINPARNMQINPFRSSDISGFYVFEVNGFGCCFFTVSAGNGCMLIFDDKLVFKYLAVASGNPLGMSYSVFNVPTLEYVAFLSQNSCGGYNWYSLTGEWKFFMV